MKYIFLGNSGLKVSPVCLGTMTYGEEWGNGSNKKISTQIFEEFVDAGGNFVDMANIYTEGTSEKYLGEMIHSNRDYIVLGTKYSLSLPTSDPNNAGNSRKSLRRSVEASLKRLNTDYIDLLWLHAWDFTTPVEEVMKSLNDLVSAGKVNYIGISDAPAWIVAQANTLADLKGYTPFIANQFEYNLSERTPERDLLPMSRAFNMGVTAWSPLAAGLLTGKYLENQESERRMDGTSFRFNTKNTEIAKKVVKIAKSMGVTPANVALAWLIEQNVIPIIGARTVAQLKDNMKSMEVEISKKDLQILDEVSAIDLGFPHTFALREGPTSVMYGGMIDQIEGVDNPNIHKKDQLLRIAKKLADQSSK